MNRSMTKAAIVCAAAVLFTGVGYAGPHDAPVVDQRERQQQKRIEQGKKSGQLTKREAARLEREQAKINKDEEKARADGKITPAERRKLKREQDRASRNIYREKHDAQQK